MPESRSSVAAILRRHTRIAIDSNVLIYLLEGSGARADRSATIVDAIGRGEVEGAMSSIAIAEILVPAAQRNDGVGFEQLAATIRDLGVRVIALDAALAEDAAWIRGRTGAGMPDAIHLASARAAEATVFVSNDRRLPILPHLEIAILDDLVA